MEKRKICIISIYFGKLPASYAAWAYSCSKNPDIDFMLVTDAIKESEYENIRVLHMQFSDLIKLARRKIGEGIILDNPYKLCDYKPVFGVILGDYLQGYDYWAHCDIDLVFGDLRKFFTEYQLEKYDKFLPLGHFCLYRNTEEVNSRYLLPADITNPHNVTFYTAHHLAYDEKEGINQIYKQYEFPAFFEEIYADIDFRHKRMTTARWKSSKHFPLPYHSEELFFWKEGHAYHAYVEDGSFRIKEVLYIHFQKRRIEDHIKDYGSVSGFAICSASIEPISGDITVEMLGKYNPYAGKLVELFEIRKFEFDFQMRWYVGKLKKLLKNRHL